MATQPERSSRSRTRRGGDDTAMISTTTRVGTTPRLGATATLTVVVVAVVVGMAGVSGTVAAAGNTTVGFSPSNASVAVGENTTYEVIVADADGGVGAYELTVSAADSSVASVRTIAVAGNASFTNTTAADGMVSAEVALLDTNDTGRVALARIGVTGVGEGSTNVSVNVTALGDEDGRTYDVRATHDARLVVGNPAPSRNTTTETGPASQTARIDSTAVPTAKLLGNNTTGKTTLTASNSSSASGMDSETTANANSTNQGTASHRSNGEDATEPATTNGSGPGFGLVVAVVALVLGVGRVLVDRPRDA